MQDRVRQNLLQIQEDIAPYKPNIIAVTKYFDETAIINAYNAGLRDFAESRVVEAVKKIDTMTVNAAYPDEWPEYMDSVQIVPPSEGGSFVDNYLNIRSVSMEDNIARKDEPIEPDDWSGVSTYAVNAF